MSKQDALNEIDRLTGHEEDYEPDDVVEHVKVALGGRNDLLRRWLEFRAHSGSLPLIEKDQLMRDTLEMPK